MYVTHNELYSFVTMLIAIITLVRIIDKHKK